MRASQQLGTTCNYMNERGGTKAIYPLEQGPGRTSYETNRRLIQHIPRWNGPEIPHKIKKRI